MWLTEGVAKILCCCAKLFNMLFTIGLWHVEDQNTLFSIAWKMTASKRHK